MEYKNDRQPMDFDFEPLDNQQAPIQEPQSQPQPQPNQNPYGYYQYNPQYQQNPYAWTPPQESGKPKKEKKHTGRIVAILIAVALLGTAGGALITTAINAIVDRNTQATMAQQPDGEMPDAQQPEAGTPKDEQPAPAQKPQDSEASFEIITTPLPGELASNDANRSLTPAQVYAMNVDAVVGIRTQTTTNVFGQMTSQSSAGTGFVLSEDGYIITNHHVVNGAQTIKVAMYDGTQYEAALIGSDEMNDVALLKIEANGLQTVTVGNTDEIVVGEEVIAIGNPLGELTFTMTQGYISALDREINTDGTPINMLQTDAAINSGNSGGPLFDMNGNVIGVTTAKYSGQTTSGTTIEGIGFAIPINDVLRIVYDLQENGYVTGRAYFGIIVKDMDATTAATYGLPTGAFVDDVGDGTCAEKAGMEVGDIIIRVGEQTVSDKTDLSAVLRDYRAGDTETVTVFRAGAEVELEVTFDERPSQDQVDASMEEYQQDQQNQQGQQGGQFSIPGFGFDEVPDGFDFNFGG